MPLPEKYHLDALRKLRGDASVTFPGGNEFVYRVERVVTVPRGGTVPQFLSLDEEYESALLVERQIIGGDANNVEVYCVWHTIPGVETTRHTTDEETRCAVTITTQIVITPDSPYSDEPGITREYQPINKIYGTLITTTINGGYPPPERFEYRYTDYTFPALLKGISGIAVMSSDGTPRVILNSDRRSAFTRQALARVDIYYGTKTTLDGVIAGIALFQPRLNDLVYNGVCFDINERNVLNDAFPAISFTLISPKWPDLTDNFVPTITSPTATEYEGMIGTYQPISATLAVWRAGWYRLEVAHIKMQ